MNSSHVSNRIDIVFDIYNERSIKSTERFLRGSHEGIRYANIRPGHKIKQWRRLLACGESKTKLITFIVQDWTERLNDRLGTKTMFVTRGSKCFKITSTSSTEITALLCSQEEADTRMILHAAHAAEEFGYVILASDDTDVLIIAMAMQSRIPANLYIRCGNTNTTRIIAVQSLCMKAGKEICSDLPGMHAFTGCDSVHFLDKES